MKKSKKRKVVKVVSVPTRQKVENLLPDQEFFRRIEFPSDFRRNLLEASKSTLSGLKGVYAVKDIRQKKLQKLMALQRSVREIRLLIQKAEEMMPKYTKHEAVKKFPHLAEPKPKKIVPPKPIPVPKPIKKVPEPMRERTMSELDRLSSSLENIEKKIQSLPYDPARPRTEKKQEQKAPVAAKAAAPEKAKKQEEKDDLGVELGLALDRIHKKLKEM